MLIGVNEGGGEDTPLRYAERDAERMGEVLSDLGDVAREDIILLRGADADEVRRVLERVARRIDAEREAPGDSESGSLLYFYYSGHSDADSLHLEGTELPFEELSELLKGVSADVRLAVVDSCRSGELLRYKGVVPAEPFAIQVKERLASDGLAIITSAAANEDAQESERLKGSVFTHHFLAGLHGAADVSRDGRVTLTEAYQYGYTHTLMATTKAPTLQHPSYAFDLQGRDELVLTQPAGAARMGHLSLDVGGVYVLFEQDRSETIVAEASVVDGGTLALRAGAYTVRRREASRVYEADVLVESDASVSLALEDMVLVPYGQTVRKGYAAERRSAVGLLLGGGGTAGLTDGVGPGLQGNLGVRVDLEEFSLYPRIRYAVHEFENEDLTGQQDAIGVEVSILRLFDVGPVSPGAGLRMGADGIRQRFDTAGVAAERYNLVGRGGPVLRAEYALRPQLLLGLESGVDIALLQAQVDGQKELSTAVVPFVSFDLSLYP